METANNDHSLNKPIEDRQNPSSILQVIQVILLIFLCLQALSYGWHALQVIRFPHDIDNEEGFLLWHSLQINQGKWQYQPIEETPHIGGNYPPLYALFCSIGTALWGPTLAVGRTITFLSALGIAIFLGSIVLRQGGQVFPALVAGLLFLGTYHVYTWGTYHRVDFLALLFSTIALWACVSEKRLAWVLLFSILALFTRQTTLAAPLAIGFTWLFQQQVRKALTLWALIGVIVLVIYFFFNERTGGEYFRHTVLYHMNKFKFDNLPIYFGHLLKFYGILCAFGLFHLLHSIEQRHFDLQFWFLLFGSAFALLIVKIGASSNYFLELMLALCWTSGYTLAKGASLAEPVKKWGQHLILAMLLIQVFAPFHFPYFSPITKTQFAFAWTPSAEDRKREEILSYMVARTQGPVMVELAGIALRAGKEPIHQPSHITHLEQQRLWDPTPLLRRIAEQEFELIILRQNMDQATAGNDMITPSMIQAIRENYRMVQKVPGRHTFYFHRPIKRL